MMVGNDKIIFPIERSQQESRKKVLAQIITKVWVLNKRVKDVGRERERER